MNWHAKTYGERLQEIDLDGAGNPPGRDAHMDALRRKANEEPAPELPDDAALPVVERVPGRLDPMCPCCGTYRPAGVLIDVSMLPSELTNDAKWWCDGCKTRALREQWQYTNPADGTVKPLVHSDLCRMLGAPQERIDAMKPFDAQPNQKASRMRSSAPVTESTVEMLKTRLGQ